MTHAVCPGSFDPPTLGHLDIIGRAAGLFDRVTVAVLVNPDKTGPVRRSTNGSSCCAATTAEWPNVAVDSFHGLLVDYCRRTASPRSSRACGRSPTSTTSCRWRR